MKAFAHICSIDGLLKFGNYHCNYCHPDQHYFAQCNRSDTFCDECRDALFFFLIYEGSLGPPTYTPILSGHR